MPRQNYDIGLEQKNEDVYSFSRFSFAALIYIHSEMHSDPSSFYGYCKARWRRLFEWDCLCSKRSLMSTVFCACKFSEKYCTWIVMVVNNIQISRSSGKHDLRVTRWEEISSQKLAPKCDTRAHITLFPEPVLVRGNRGKFQSEKSSILKKCRARTWEREPRWDFSRFSLAHAGKQRSISFLLRDHFFAPSQGV